MGELIRCFFFIKHNTLWKHPRRATCLFAMRSLIFSLSLKISCWWACRSSLFVNSRASIWLSRWASAASFSSQNCFHKGFGLRNFTSQKETIKTGFLQQDSIILWHVQPDVSFHDVFNAFKPQYIFLEYMSFNCHQHTQSLLTHQSPQDTLPGLENAQPLCFYH